MNKQKTMLLAAVLVLIALAAGVILSFKSRQRLGAPGLKLAPVPSMDERGQPIGQTSVALPEKVLDLVSTNLPISDVELGYLPKDTTYGRRRYRKDASFFSDLSVVLMGTDRTSIHKPQICLDGQGWKIEKAQLVTILIEKPHRYELPVMKLTAGKSIKVGGGQAQNLRALYLYWFVSEHRLTAEHKERMWSVVEDLIKTGVMPRWAYVSCFSACYPAEEESVYQGMRRLVAAAVPEFQLTTLPAASEPARTTVAAQ